MNEDPAWLNVGSQWRSNQPNLKNENDEKSKRTTARLTQRDIFKTTEYFGWPDQPSSGLDVASKPEESRSGLPVGIFSLPFGRFSQLLLLANSLYRWINFACHMQTLTFLHFFPKPIAGWNYLPKAIVSSTSLESFRFGYHPFLNNRYISYLVFLSNIYTVGGGKTPLYRLYRYVRPQRVWFFGCFGHK